VTGRSGGILRAATAGAAAVALLALGGCSSDRSGPAAAPGTTTPTNSVAEAPQGFGAGLLVVTLPDGTVQEWCVWLADTPARREQGLMAVTDPGLGGAEAMVFVFPGDTTSGFWMKDTLLPLSIAWYSSEGAFVSTADMDPCPADATDCPAFSPGEQYRYAVEVPQGELDDLGLVDGSAISLGGSCSPGAHEA